MHARNRKALLARPGSGVRRIAAPFVAVTLLAGLAWGCGTQSSPSPNATPSPSVVPTPVIATAETPSSMPAFADTLTIGWNPKLDPYGWPYARYGFRIATDGTELPFHNATLASVVYSSLYRWDATYNAVPDLADGPCVPQGDGTVIRCRLIATTFQDGTPLTADDVAYSYQLLMRSAFQDNGWYTDRFKEARAVDSRTVDFVLTSVDPTFLTEKLPWLPILPRQAVETEYTAFRANTRDLRAADLTKLADSIDAELSASPPVCTTRLDQVAPMLSKIGYPLYRDDFSRTGTFDACAYVGTVSGYLHQTATALGATGIDAVAYAYWLLPIAQRPIGTGPYKFVSEDADRIHLETFAGYHGGVAATRYLDFVPAKGDGSDLVAGTLDIWQLLPARATLGTAFEAAAPSHDVRVATPPGDGYEALQFNVRPGRLFSDLNLREALQLCIDLPRDVDAVTGGEGTPAYGPVAASSWAYDPTLPKPARDSAAARALIEASGWKPGADGIYARDGVRLAAEVVVRADNAPRIKMLDLVALQAKDCGMDIRSHPLSWDVIQTKFLVYPYVVPDTGRPFDLYIGSWGGATDPADVFSVYALSSINDVKGASGNSYLGFKDPTLERLLTAGMATYDQATRASLYRQAQQEVGAQLPNIFLWEYGSYDVVRSAVSTVDGPLDLTKPNWSWQPERLVVATTNP
jgi:ABC-type transport system substrate-binding protein